MESENVKLLHRWYDAFRRGDLESPMAILSPDVEFNVNEGFPLGGTYIGNSTVLYNYYPRAAQFFAARYDYWHVEPEEFLDVGNTVVSLGHYRWRVKGSELERKTPFAHVWRVQDGKLVKTRQYTDTLVIAQGLET